MTQPPYVQKIIPCTCGSLEPYWHGDTERVYCCDACWQARPGATDAAPFADQAPTPKRDAKLDHWRKNR